MANKKRKNNKKNGSTVGVIGVRFLLKYLFGDYFIRRNELGQPTIELINKNYGRAAEIIFRNIEQMDIGAPIIDGLKIGLLRKFGLNTTIMKVGNTTFKSV